MSYRALNYMNNLKAPVGKWVCAPTSTLGPFSSAPTGAQIAGPDYCGQCVSYVKTVCTSLPSTGNWKKGEPVKDNKDISPGTDIATFNASGSYNGHAAIYVCQSSAGILYTTSGLHRQTRRPLGRDLCAVTEVASRITGTTTMSWNRIIVALALALLSGCSIYPPIAAEVCPSRHGAPLRSVDVFDGSPQELATLMADKAGEQSGYWKLGYVYDAGRFVTIRCKYADKQVVDVKLSNRVEKCDSKIDSKKTLKLYCK